MLDNFFFYIFEIHSGFYTYSTSPFGLTTFQVHNRHLGLVPTVLHFMTLEFHSPLENKDTYRKNTCVRATVMWFVLKS